MASIHPDLLAILICPQPGCGAKLRLESDGPAGATVDAAAAVERLVCTACRRAYRIEQRWPVMIPEEAEAPQ